MSELPPAGEGGSAALSEESKSRKPRPAVQLYRPGMMKGVDITKVGQSRTLPRTKPPKSQPITEITTNDPRKSEKLDEWSVSGRSNNRGGRAGRGRSRGGGKGDTIRSYNAADLDQRSEIASVCSNDDIQSEGGYKRRRRRRKSSGGSSSTSSTYRYESNSTITSSRCNINKEAVSNSPRQRLINNVKGFHSSSQSLFDRPPSSLGGRQYRNYNWNDEHSWRFNSKSPSKKQNRNEQFRGDGTAAADYNQKHFERNHRYSSYREQSRGSNSNKNTSRSNHDDRFVSAYEGSDMYASKRSGQQKRGGRGRGQQQSNGPFRSDRHAGSNSGSRNKSETRSGQRLDEEYRAEEESKDRQKSKTTLNERAFSPSQYQSFQDLCASFNTLPFNWSDEVEEVERRKKEREERERSEEVPSSSDAARMRESNENDRNHANRRASARGTNMRYSQRNRCRNDSYTSHSSRTNQNDSNDDRTSTNDDHHPHVYPDTIKAHRKSDDHIQMEKTSSRKESGLDGVDHDLRIRNTASGSEKRSSKAISDCDRSDECESAKLSSNEPSTSNPVTHIIVPPPSSTPPNSNTAGSPSFHSPKSSHPVAVVSPFARVASSSSFVIDTSIPPPNLIVPPPSVAVIPHLNNNVQLLSNTPVQSMPLPLCNSGVVWRKERGRKMEVPPTEWPIHTEISRNEGPLIQKLNDQMAICIARINETGNVDAGEELLNISCKLSELFVMIMTRDIEYTYAMNLEQHMWKQCFYKPIELLRFISNSSHASAFSQSNVLKFRSLLITLIQRGLEFYTSLLNNKYEVRFGFLIDDFLYWPTSVPNDDFANCTQIGSRSMEGSDRSLKIAVLSAQRLAISIGDLHRYLAMVRGVKDYSAARLWYTRGAQLGPANGRSYNQIALLAVYAIIQHEPLRSARDLAFMRVPSFISAKNCKIQCKWVDIVFYYIRALGAHHAFETARQALFTAFNDISKKINEYEIELDERFGLTTASGMNAQHKEKEIYKGEKPHEVWISSDGKRTNRDDNDMVDSSNAFDFENDSIVKLYRRTVPYLLHTSGLLITKIGMEQFESESERALLQLQALISRDECPMSAVQVVQICALYIFAVHNCSSISVEMNTCSLLQQRAVQMVLSLFAILLTCLDEFKHDLNLILIGEKPIPSKMRRVMPALWVLSEWLSTPSINRLYKGMPSLGPIESNLFQIDVWHTLASVSNALVHAESEGVLARNVPGLKDGSEVDNDKQIEITLPECVYLASFVDVFPITPKSIKLSQPSARQFSNDDGMLLALHARASSILTAAEYLDGSGLHCFSFDEHLDRFISSCDKRTERDMSTSKFDDRISSDIQEVADDERDRVVIEVRPNYLVPDTNAFIDHLESIQRIVDNGRYTVLVPTTVASELSCLSKPAATRPAMGSAAQMGQSIQFVSMDQEDEQENWVMERARSAVAFLKKASEQKTGHIATVTSKGSRLPSVFFGAEQCSSSSINDKTVNDDMILSSCSALSSLLPNPLSASTESATIKPSRLYRSVVLLTDDRALSIKAICANIPCRTIASFLKWAIIQ